MLSAVDAAELTRARRILEHPGLASRMADFLGRPVEGLLKVLPAGGQRLAHGVVERALQTALRAAMKSLRGAAPEPSRNRLHKAMVGATGAVGGFFGLAGVAIELPVSTTLMLRSIAEIARSRGEDLTSAEARVECLSVFALGGRSRADDAAESAYFALRATLAKAVSEAAQHLASHGLAAKGAPVLARLLAQIAGRFESTLAEKVALQSLPLLGGATGAALNVAFIDHFQDMAWGHFTVRRLERIYGQATVRSAWDRPAA